MDEEPSGVRIARRAATAATCAVIAAVVASAVVAPELPIPSSSGYTAIALAIVSVASVVAKHLWLPKKYWGYVPNWNAVGLAFVVPQVYYSIAM